ncbi:alpha/beta fold hydrolase [Teichococcus aerofrigidensis]
MQPDTSADAFDLDAARLALEEALRPLAARARRHETPCGAGHMVWHEWGAGPPLVLLHGGSGSWRHWARTIPALAERWRVIAADLPGLGESEAPPRPEAPEEIAAILSGGLDSLLGGARYRLAGFSFGGLMAGLLARRDVARLDGLVLVGAVGLGQPYEPPALRGVLGQPRARQMAIHRDNLATLMIADPARIDPAALAMQDWHTWRTRFRSGAFAGTTLLRDAILDLPVPLGGIWGARDTTARPDVPTRLAQIRAWRPDARLHAIPGAGHWVMWEAPQAFNAALAGLLEPGFP